MTERNYEVMFDGQAVPVKMWTKDVPVEPKARQQLANIASMPFIHKHIAVMPDVHLGKGATVGSVIPTKGAIIPAAVGVDIGCGMVAVRTSLTANDLPDNLSGVRSAIEAAVPHGRTNNGGPGDRGAWHDIPNIVEQTMFAGTDDHPSLFQRLSQIVEKSPGLFKDAVQAGVRAGAHLGTLGTGNHFIEVCLDKKDRVWVMLHSGSRGVGNRIGTYFINLAKEDMKKWFVNLPDKDLAYLPEGTEHFDAYIEAVEWAQEYALFNRVVMMSTVLRVMRSVLGREFSTEEKVINCHHNYVEKENHFGANVWVTRKGAVRARAGDLGIIPGSMGARSFIVRGKGNPDSFCSCSHGAGRVMSRAEAKRRFTVEDHIEATKGVECRKDAGVLDETPRAYKDIDAVMAAQADLVEIVEELRQVVCVKG